MCCLAKAYTPQAEIPAASTRRTPVRRADGFLFPATFRTAPSMIPQWKPRWADSRRKP